MQIVVEDVCKSLHKRVILSHVSCQMESGHVYGFVGRNGSGKTMLFRAVSGLMRIDSGRIAADGKVLHRDMEVLDRIGIMLEHAGLYPEKTGLGNLKYLASLKNIAGQDEIREAISRVGLNPDDKRVYRKYSLGMKQRLAIAQAIMEKPDVLMLDEPTNALDEEGVELFRNIVISEKERGALVMLASHSAEDVRLLCDVVFTMKDGTCVRME